MAIPEAATYGSSFPAASSYHHPDDQGNYSGTEIEDLTTLFGNGWWYYDQRDEAARRRRRRGAAGSNDDEVLPPIYYRILPAVLISALLFSCGVIAGLKLLPISSSTSPAMPVLSSAQEEQQLLQGKNVRRGHSNSHHTHKHNQQHKDGMHLQEEQIRGGAGGESDQKRLKVTSIMSAAEEEASELCISNSAFPWTVSTCSCNSDLPVLDGVDVVAYFSLDEESEDTHIDGSSSYTSQLNGYTFWFSNAENQALFDGDPWKYAPMFGGFCSWGMSEEVWPEYDWSPSNLGPNGNIDVWIIYKDHLFLFLDETPKGKFEQNPEAYLVDGTKRWNDWFGSRESSPFNTACVSYTTTS